MNPGRDLDILIAEKVMGLKPQIVKHEHPTLGTFIIDQTKMNAEAWVPHYSTDIAASWEIRTKFKTTCHAAFPLFKQSYQFDLVSSVHYE